MNSIEEDIKIIEKYLSHFKKVCSPEMLKKDEIIKVIQYKEIQALQHILADYKRALKENEELLEVKVSTSAHNRILELEKENKELKERIREHTLLISPYYIKENYIPIQKIKDKIEELKKKVEELTDDKGYWGGSDLLDQIEVLQELLKSEE